MFELSDSDIVDTRKIRRDIYDKQREYVKFRIENDPNDPFVVKIIKISNEVAELEKRLSELNTEKEKIEYQLLENANDEHITELRMLWDLYPDDTSSEHSTSDIE